MNPFATSHKLLRFTRTWRVARVFGLGPLAAASLIGLSSCATPYAPYAGDDAAKLRIRLAPKSGYGGVHSFLQSVSGGQCGKRIAVPLLSEPPVDIELRRPETGGRTLPSDYPRADMHDSAHPARTDSAELRLSPGVYALSLVGGYQTSQCLLAGTLQLAPSRQYDLDFSFSAGQCVATVRRLEAPQGPDARLQWSRYLFEPSTPCKDKP
jgi:hypothetical protein